MNNAKHLHRTPLLYDEIFDEVTVGAAWITLAMAFASKLFDSVCCSFEIVKGFYRKTALGNQLLALLLVRSPQPYHDRDLDANFLVCLDDASGDHVA